MCHLHRKKKGKNGFGINLSEQEEIHAISLVKKIIKKVETVVKIKTIQQQ